jgi:type III secretory pathway component EscS
VKALTLCLLQIQGSTVDVIASLVTVGITIFMLMGWPM